MEGELLLPGVIIVEGYGVANHEHDGLFGGTLEASVVEVLEGGASDALRGHAGIGDDGDGGGPVMPCVGGHVGEELFEVGVGHEDDQGVGIRDFMCGQCFTLPRGICTRERT